MVIRIYPDYTIRNIRHAVRTSRPRNQAIQRISNKGHIGHTGDSAAGSWSTRAGRKLIRKSGTNAVHINT